MTPTDPPKGSAGPPRRPASGGGPTYRHPEDAPHVSSYHDGVHEHAPDDELHNPDVAHEHSDVNVRAIIMSAVVLVIVTIVSHFVVYGVFRWMDAEAAANQPPVSPLARPATDMPASVAATPAFTPSGAAAGPQLLTNEPMALEKHRAEENTRLQNYGWANEGAGIAHIPIEEAKKLIVERGLPVRAEAAVPPTLGTHLPAAGEASGGRVITVPLPEPAADQPAPQQPAAKPH